MKDYKNISTNKIIFLETYFEQKIWGGNYLNKLFKYKEKNNIGEAWIVSAINNKENKILNDKNYNLKTLWKQKNYLFNNSNYKYKEFPLLFKILAPKDDLSIQVHPDNIYAKKFNSLGKSESWYIDKILTQNSNKVIIGHNANNKEELKNLIYQKKWGDLISYFKMQEGDVIDIFPGLVHALLKNIVVFELQQSSDITFRLFDYDRKDKEGKFRKIHLKDSLEVISFKKNIKVNNFNKILKNKVIQMINNNYYYFGKIEIENEMNLEKFFFDQDFLLFFVKKGKGKINDIDIEKNDSFIIPSIVNKIKFTGMMIIFIAYPKYNK